MATKGPVDEEEYLRDEENLLLTKTTIPPFMPWHNVAREVFFYNFWNLPANMVINVGFAFALKELNRSGPKTITAENYILPIKLILDSTTVIFFGTGVACAGAKGEGKEGKIKTITGQSFLIAGGLTPLVLTLCYTSGALAKRLGATKDVAHIVQSYFTQYGWGFPVIYPIAILTQATIPYGTLPNAVNLFFATGVNCALIYALTRGVGVIPAMPIIGAALGTSLSNILSLAEYLIYLAGTKKYAGIYKDHAHYKKRPALKNVLNVGLTTSFNMLAQLGSMLVGSAFDNNFLDQTAKQQQSITTLPISFLVAANASFADGAAVLISERMGANDSLNPRQYWCLSQGFAVCFGLAGMGFLKLTAPYYIRWFTDSKVATHSFIHTTEKLILWGAANQTISSIGAISTGALRGIGNTTNPMWLNVGLKIGLVGILNYILMAYGDFGVFAPFLADMLVSTFLYSPILFKYAHDQLGPKALKTRLSQPPRYPLIPCQDTILSLVSKTKQKFLGFCYSPKPITPSLDLDIQQENADTPPPQVQPKAKPKKRSYCVLF